MDGTSGQRFDKYLSIAFAQHTSIQDDDNTPVRLGADQTSEALPEAQYCLGERELEEWIFECLGA
jgi:hypothetical protein